MQTRKRDEVWRRAKARMDRVTGPDRARAFQEELKSQGIPLGKAICRAIRDFCGENATEDQVRALGARWAKDLGVSPDGWVRFWRDRDRLRD